MNINLVRLTSVARELKGIRLACERLADCWEAQLANQGIHTRNHPADTSGEPANVSFVDEEMDAMKELEILMGRIPKSPEEEE